MIQFIKRLFQCFFDWRDKNYATKKQYDEAEVVIASSFGGKDPGNGDCKSNIFLANLANELHEEYGIPIIAQWEIGGLSNSTLKIIWGSRFKGEYLDTFEVAYQAAKKCKELGIKKVLVLAHPDHALRCKWVLEEIGKKLKLKLKVSIIDASGCPYDPQSNQKWTRSARKFIPREILARLMYLAQGKI